VKTTLVNCLHQYLLDSHSRSGALDGPDPGVRFNYRLWRFLKSATRWYPWKDARRFMQTQGYWVLANWRLSHHGHPRASQVAIECCQQIVQAQRADGAWVFPDPEWRDRVTTVEGLWASFALLETYLHTKEAHWLEPVLRWDRFFKEKIGFQTYRDGLAVNYFAGRVDSLVPNNSFSAIRYLARLDQAAESSTNAETIDRLLNFLELTQQASGEFPYELNNPRMQHFQCFQYHAFLLLDMLDYYQVSRNLRAISIMQGLASFLLTGVTPSGDVMYQCGIGYRHVNYHAAVTMAALHQFLLSCPSECSADLANEIRLKVPLIELQLTEKQRPDGSLPHSRGDYRLLSDQRSYPRYLAMMLYHFLLTQQTAVHIPCGASQPAESTWDTTSTSVQQLQTTPRAQAKN
jgi:hypothetical protein